MYISNLLKPLFQILNLPRIQGLSGGESGDIPDLLDLI